MKNVDPSILEFLQRIRASREPLQVRRRAGGPTWKDLGLHEAQWHRDRVLYALCAVAEKVPQAQQARMLYQVLAGSQSRLDSTARQVLQRVSNVLLVSLDPSLVLAVFLALRHARANHKHTKRAMLHYLLNHPQAESLARRRRPALVDCLEHAVGRDVARACAKQLIAGGSDDGYLRRSLLRFAVDPARAARWVARLYSQTGGSAELPAPKEPAAAQGNRPTALPKTVTATNRGDIAATLVHIYRGGSNAELAGELRRYVEAAAAPLPQFAGKLAIVLDASASMRGYGDREFVCISQSQALRLVLERCCQAVRVFTVGGDGGTPPMPIGDSNLASALLDALQIDPDVVAIISDGYENIALGDLERVLATLPGLDIETPVVFCHSKFTDKDDLTLRRCATSISQVEFWHQENFRDVLWYLFAAAGNQQGAAFVRDCLLHRLEGLEKELSPWTRAQTIS